MRERKFVELQDYNNVGIQIHMAELWAGESSSHLQGALGMK